MYGVQSVCASYDTVYHLSISETSEKSAPRRGVLCHIQHHVLASMSEAVAQQEEGMLVAALLYHE
jgi:hypothetical protein